MEHVPLAPQLESAVQNPLREVALGIALLVVVIMFHGLCMRLINRRFNRSWSQVSVSTPLWKINLILSSVVTALAATHMIESMAFVLPFMLLDILPNARDAYFFALESYTTLGASSIRLPEEWRLLGPVIAMTGLFAFGWTGSVLVAVMTQVNTIDRAQAKVQLKEEAATDAADASKPSGAG